MADGTTHVQVPTMAHLCCTPNGRRLAFKQGAFDLTMQLLAHHSRHGSPGVAAATLHLAGLLIVDTPKSLFTLAQQVPGVGDVIDEALTSVQGTGAPRCLHSVLQEGLDPEIERRLQAHLNLHEI